MASPSGNNPAITSMGVNMDKRTFGYSAPFEATAKAVDFDRPLDTSRDTAVWLRRADEADFRALWAQLGSCPEEKLLGVLREAICYEKQIRCDSSKQGHFARAVGLVLAAGYSRLGADKVDSLRSEHRRRKAQATGPVEYVSDAETRFASHA